MLILNFYFTSWLLWNQSHFTFFLCWTNLAVLRDVYKNACGIIFKNCHITSFRIKWKGEGRKILKYLLHKLGIYYRLVIGRYHIRWDTSCSRRKPAVFPKVTFHEWNSVVICIFTLHFDMQTTAVGLCIFGPPTHTLTKYRHLPAERGQMRHVYSEILRNYNIFND